MAVIGPTRTLVMPPPRNPARSQLRRTAPAAGVRRRFAPHQLRHAHAVEMAREGVPLIVIQRQLGHSNLGLTSVYLQGIDNAEIIDTVHARRAPMIPVSASLRL
jgi:site-specific recombinase XerD